MHPSCQPSVVDACCYCCLLLCCLITVSLNQRKMATPGTFRQEQSIKRNCQYCSSSGLHSQQQQKPSSWQHPSTFQQQQHQRKGPSSSSDRDPNCNGKYLMEILLSMQRYKQYSSEQRASNSKVWHLPLLAAAAAPVRQQQQRLSSSVSILLLVVISSVTCCVSRLIKWINSWAQK